MSQMQAVGDVHVSTEAEEAGKKLGECLGNPHHRERSAGRRVGRGKMQKWAGTRFVMWDGSAGEIGMKKVVAESVPDKEMELSGELGVDMWVNFADSRDGKLRQLLNF